MNDNPKNEQKEKRKRYHHGISGALLLIVIGTILLLNNFGFVPWSIWDLIWRFWPIMLILWGLDAIAGGSDILSALSTLIGIAIIGLVVIYCASLVNLTFDRWLTKNYPQWSQLKRRLPEFNLSRSNHRIDLFFDNQDAIQYR